MLCCTVFISIWIGPFLIFKTVSLFCLLVERLKYKKKSTNEKSIKLGSRGRFIRKKFSKAYWWSTTNTKRERNEAKIIGKERLGETYVNCDIDLLVLDPLLPWFLVLTDLGKKAGQGRRKAPNDLIFLFNDDDRIALVSNRWIFNGTTSFRRGFFFSHCIHLL